MMMPWSINKKSSHITRTWAHAQIHRALKSRVEYRRRAKKSDKNIDAKQKVFYFEVMCTRYTKKEYIGFSYAPPPDTQLCHTDFHNVDAFCCGCVVGV